ncbi:hypothetical protein MASR2M78_20760 [Treponema sp.]
MAYDEDLDMMIYAIVEKYRALKKNMFGGTCYMENNVNNGLKVPVFNGDQVPLFSD